MRIVAVVLTALALLIVSGGGMSPSVDRNPKVGVFSSAVAVANGERVAVSASSTDGASIISSLDGIAGGTAFTGCTSLKIKM